MAFETNDAVKELRDKALSMFPFDEKLARATYHWHAADEIERLRTALKEIGELTDVECDTAPTMARMALAYEQIAGEKS